MDTTHVIPICILSMFNQIVEFCISDVAFNTNRNTLYHNFIKFVIFHRCFRRNTYEICGLEYVLKRRIASYNVWIVISPTYSAWKHFQMSWCISVEPRIVVAVIMLSMKRFSMSNCQLDHRKRHHWNSSHDTQHPCQNRISKYLKIIGHLFQVLICQQPLLIFPCVKRGGRLNAECKHGLTGNYVTTGLPFPYKHKTSPSVGKFQLFLSVRRIYTVLDCEYIIHITMHETVASIINRNTTKVYWNKLSTTLRQTLFGSSV